MPAYVVSTWRLIFFHERYAIHAEKTVQISDLDEEFESLRFDALLTSDDDSEPNAARLFDFGDFVIVSVTKKEVYVFVLTMQGFIHVDRMKKLPKKLTNSKIS
jgi:hypothetical protein